MKKKYLLKVLKELQFCCQGFCDIAKNDYYTENNLAKFGYILDMKIEKKRNRILNHQMCTYSCAAATWLGSSLKENNILLM